MAVMPAQGVAAHLKGGKLNKELDCLGPRGLAASDLLSAPRQTSQLMPYEYTPQTRISHIGTVGRPT